MNQLASRLKAIWIRRVHRRRVLFQDRYGLHYYLNPTDDLELFFSHRGWFEVAEQEFCRRHLNPGMTVVDVGAYIGMFTCLMAKQVLPQGQVHAFEPSQRSYQRLCENLAVNSFQNVTVNRQAVFSGNGDRALYCYGAPFESLSSVVRHELSREHNVLRSVSEEQVGTVSLDDYCEKWAIRRIDLLKIDAEGAEPEVFAGADQLLSQGRIRAVLFEVGPGVRQELDRLKSHGFRFSVLSPDGSLLPASESKVSRAVNIIAVHESNHASACCTESTKII